MVEHPFESQPSDRLSITLTDGDLLRGTTTAVLLSKCGATLRSTSGGASIASDSAQADMDYQKSCVVTTLDAFLSHSWHAPWEQKYLTLLYYFNMGPAVATAMISASVTFIIRSKVTLTDTEETDGIIHNNRGVCLTAGAISFLAVLLSWHHLVARSPLYVRRIFLDKMCIHQTDMAKKMQGIRNIGAYLAASKMMLVVWDETYFERLWCVFEMASFLYARPTGRITMVPIILGKMVLFMLATSYIMEVVTNICHRFPIIDDRGAGVIFCLASIGRNTWIAGHFRQYIQSRKLLDSRLKNFKADDAKCFCCTHLHKHPDTGARIPCDRSLVYASIVKWYDPDGKDMGRAMQTFNGTVQDAFRQAVVATLGRHSQLPYALAVASGLFGAITWLDYSRGCTFYWAALMALNELLLTSPFAMAIFTRSIFMLSSNVYSDLGVALICNMIPITLWIEAYHAFVPRCDFLSFAWMLFEVVTVFFLYRHELRAHLWLREFVYATQLSPS